MFIKDSKKYKDDECGKNFTLNIGSKGYIAAAHEKKIQLWSMWQKFGYSLQDAILCKKYSTNHIYKLELVSHIRVSIDHDTS